MSMDNIFGIAGTALNAQLTRMNATASNLANAGTVATKLLVTAGPRVGFSLLLDRREITIGRSESSDLVINDEFASTQHAKLVLINNDWLIQDLNSTNGTFLDGERIGTPAVVKLKSQVRIGKTVFELRE